MKRFSLAAVTALSITFAAQALAQQIAVEVAPPVRTTIKEYVVKEQIRPVTIQEQVTVGTPLAAGVELQPVPPAWGPTLTRYNYVYHDNRVVLVEPTSRNVVQIIE